MLFSQRFTKAAWSPLCKMSPLLKRPTSFGIFSASPMRSYINDNRISLNSNNFLVLEENDGFESPTLQFR